MHPTTAQLEASIPVILAAPKTAGPVEMIVRRPAEGQREIVESAEITASEGLVGDNWSKRLNEGEPLWGAQLTLMNARVIGAIARERHRWPLAGDQIYVDLDISVDNLPPGARIEVGDAIVEISEMPHTGCAKFASRFGKEALRFANVGVGRSNRFRGVNAFVVEGGTVTVGDEVRKL